MTPGQGKTQIQTKYSENPLTVLPVTITAGASIQVDLSLPGSGSLSMSAKDENSSPIPVKVTIVDPFGDQACPADSIFRQNATNDDQGDKLPPGIARIDYIGPSGTKTIEIEPGTYTVYVSRGLEYSLFSQTATVTFASPASIDAQLYRVVDTTEWVSGDLHVHSINSTDSPVPLTERVMTYMGEGVDILVATDHDSLTDYQPVIRSLNGEEFLSSIVGDEVTTWDSGHFNAFPLYPDQDKVSGGPVDWAGGTGPSLTPDQLFTALLNAPGPKEKIIQVNHPRNKSSSGNFQAHFTAIGLDTLTFTTTTDPQTFRMPPVGQTCTLGTCLFSDKFNAMEVMNGNDFESFASRLNDWLTFLNQNFTVTATGVTDNHRRFTTQSGFPRTYITSTTDNPWSIDRAEIIHNIVLHKATVAGGPFVTFTATSGTQVKNIGEVLVSMGQPVTLTIRVQSPTWIEFDTVDILSNTLNTASPAPGAQVNTYPTTTAASFTVDPMTATTVTLPSGGERFDVGFTFTTTPTVDSWYVVAVRVTQEATKDLWPVAPGIKAISLTNPIFVDVDGDGFRVPDGTATRAPLSAAQMSLAPQELLNEGDVRAFLKALRALR